jgi:hypothetical protein
MKLIDEKTLFNTSDEDAWHAIDEEHRERAGWRVEDMVRLLTELKAPTPIADRVFAELDRETAMMNRLLARIKTLNEAEKQKSPSVGVDDKGLVPSDFFDDVLSVDALIAAGKPPLWRLSTNAINHALVLINIERTQCTDRLAGRLADAKKTPQLSSRTPDPEEESDPILRIMASRKQERIDTAKADAELREKIAEHTKIMIGIRNKASPWNR